MDNGTRRLIIIRHGERCDFTFNQRGVNWIKRAFDAAGKYHQFDLNLPRNLPKRKDGYEKFAFDPPLTEMGYLQSKITGRALKDRGIQINQVFCSSSLRCVQTAVGIVKGMDSRHLQINVEPGLFEWTHWCRAIPSWIEPEEFSRLGYPVNPSYIPSMRGDQLNVSENLDEYCSRSHAVVQQILNQCATGTVLLVAHGPSMEALTRVLCGSELPSQENFMFNLQQIPYLACLQVIKQASCKNWRYGRSPVLPLTHSSNTAFDARIFSTSSTFHLNDIEQSDTKL